MTIQCHFLWSWCIHVDVDRVHDPAQPDQRFDCWARIKFEGPTFPHGKEADKDADLGDEDLDIDGEDEPSADDDVDLGGDDDLGVNTQDEDEEN